MEHLKKILFIDIETVSCVARYDELSSSMQYQWDRKSRYLKSTDFDQPTSAQLFQEKAGIFSEFAKVVCISLGCLAEIDGEWRIVLKSVADDDEKIVLHNFIEAVEKFELRFADFKFCGHNIKEFDIPFLCRRMVIHGFPIPNSMQVQGKKPWEITHLDTLDYWKFGDFKHFTSLALLADVLQIPSPKDDIDGSMVGKVYWEEYNLPRIEKYCMQDVATVAKVYLKLAGYHHIQPEIQFWAKS